MNQTIVIGAGIAGLAAAWRLSARGVGPITVLERESLTFSHSSARNAAIYRPLEESVGTVRLVQRSAELFCVLSPQRPLVRRCGVCLSAMEPRALARLTEVAKELDVAHERLQGDALTSKCSSLVGGRTTEGLWLPDGGVLDVHHVSELLRRELRHAGVVVRLSTEVRRLTVSGRRMTGVELTSGEHLPATRVVVAAGAWSAELGGGIGAPLALTPHRRHLVLLLPTDEQQLPETHPIVWNVQTGIYFRPESGGVLACPGDHEPAPAGVPRVSEGILSTLAEQLPLESPLFNSYAAVRPWACLRTMSDSKETIVGPDPRVDGLYWLAGLGGHGMGAGLGAADYLAQSFLGQTLPDWFGPMLVTAHLRPPPSFDAVGVARNP
jgi:D-arginine dehydrogenase